MISSWGRVEKSLSPFLMKINMDLSKLSTATLIEELNKRGFLASMAWSKYDVLDKLKEFNEDEDTSLELTDDQCFAILNTAVNNDYSNEEINNTIDSEIRLVLMKTLTAQTT